MKSLSFVLFLLLGCFSLVNQAVAFNVLGVETGASPDVVENQIRKMGLGNISWGEGSGAFKTLYSQQNDIQNTVNSYGFCNNKLVQVQSTKATKFDQLANFIDETIKQYGQPSKVSAGVKVFGWGNSGKVTMQWKLGSTDIMTIYQLSGTHIVSYETKSECKLVED
jgi:hypothetical protein